MPFLFAMILLFLEFLFYSFHSLYSENGNATILESLCHAEENEPQYTFHLYRYRQSHLCEGEYVAWNTTEQDYHASTE